ncbi:MAG TPA: PH domain-containing protein [Candidatus Limnocylindrales bacterium]|nr:PH domain-containing protein [Candidatus Limnocylindrales bacterium]
MRYADTLLADGERIELRTRQHWLSLVVDARHALAFWAVTILGLIVYVVLKPTGSAADLLGYLILITFLVGLVLFLFHAWQYYAQDFLITNRRVMRVSGVLSKQALDSSLEKINDAELRQSVWGRLLGFGDLEILTASESAIDRFHLLRDPVGFKKAMLEAKHELELELEGHVPTPPLRAPIVQPAGAPAAQPMPAAAAAGGPPLSASAASGRGSAATSDDVTRTLAQLAELRDRGAITADDYEAKKQELLGRL